MIPDKRGASMPETLEGGCQCGAVRYRINGSPVMAALCHCSMCRRANAAPAVAWAMYEESQVTFLGSPPAVYASSPEARRSFCGRCGTQIGFAADYIPGMIDITIGSLDEPERMPPMFHYWTSRQLPWLRVADELPRFPEFPPTE
ncbi:GFA family protein [Luteimonas suaedae]|uniref:GFA family protein n=1 Tax=Luteimonas suaedae TaxID=2605430 RepID=UPI001CA97ADE|nr:GFA family protein [Luteimonas suaedae]